MADPTNVGGRPVEGRTATLPVTVMNANGSGNSSLPISNAKVFAATSTVVTSDGTALAANATRQAFAIQNLATMPLYVKLGSGASSSSFSFVLKAGTAANDGTGGFFSDSSYIGIVTIAAASGSPRVVVCEL